MKNIADERVFHAGCLWRSTNSRYPDENPTSSFGASQINLLRYGGNMDKLITVYLYGKKYEVPDGLTIMEAFEYSGYQLVRGCGCRNGFCGACATIYRIKGTTQLVGCLACSTKVEENMCVASLPFFPLEKKLYTIEEIRPTQSIMMQLYPEIYSCIGCNSCTKACTQQLDVMQYIAYAQRGEYEKCAEASFDCAMCGVCSSRCPAGISHAQVGMLARRLTGKYLRPKAEHLQKRVDEINAGEWDAAMDEIMNKPLDEFKNMYNTREIEK